MLGIKNDLKELHPLEKEAHDKDRKSAITGSAIAESVIAENAIAGSAIAGKCDCGNAVASLAAKPTS